MGKLVNIVYKEAPGKSYAVDEADVPLILNNNPGAHVEGEAEAAARTTEQYKQQRYGDTWGKVAAGVLAVPRGMSYGLSDVGLGLLTGEAGREDLRELQERNAGVSFAGEAIGALTGGQLPGLNIAGKVGSRVARTAEGAGTLERLGKAALGQTIEGGIYGAGTGISKVGMSENPGADIEQAASTITSNMLMGGLIGGAAGTVGKGVELGLGRVKSGIEAYGAARAARSTEAKEAASVALADDVTKYRDQVREANPWLVSGSEESKLLSSSNSDIRKALNTPKSLSETGLSKQLQTQETALKNILKNKEALTAEFEAVNNRIVEQLKQKIAEAPIEAATKIELSGKALDRYKQIADVRVARKIKALEVPREVVESMIGKIESGAVRGQSETAFSKLDGLLDANQKLQEQVKGLASGRAAAGQPSVFEDIAHGAMLSGGTALLAPLLGPAAPLAAHKLARAGTDFIFKRLGNAGAAVGERAGKAVDAFLSLSKAAQKPAPVLATKVLNAVRFGQSQDEDKGRSLADAFKARSQELREQTMYMADGKAALRPEARERLGDRLAGVRAVDPMLADKLETVAARKVEYLANKVPRRPDIGGVQLGPDKWQPSDMKMREFARIVHALEDPAGVVERMATGQITPEEASAIREVFPDMFSRIKMGMISALPQLRKQLPYDRRVALSIFTGVPIDPAMDPKILSVLQSQFEEEPGSEQGTQQPTAAPQFGSISKPEPTAAQERAS